MNKIWSFQVHWISYYSLHLNLIQKTRTPLSSLSSHRLNLQSSVHFINLKPIDLASQGCPISCLLSTSQLQFLLNNLNWSFSQSSYIIAGKCLAHFRLISKRRFPVVEGFLPFPPIWLLQVKMLWAADYSRTQTSCLVRASLFKFG